MTGVLHRSAETFGWPMHGAPRWYLWETIWHKQLNCKTLQRDLQNRVCMALASFSPTVLAKCIHSYLYAKHKMLQLTNTTYHRHGFRLSKVDDDMVHRCQSSKIRSIGTHVLYMCITSIRKWLNILTTERHISNVSLLMKRGKLSSFLKTNYCYCEK